MLVLILCGVVGRSALNKKTETFICRVGKKVEVTLEEEILRDVWFPAAVVEDLGNNRFLVEYKELQRVSIDRRHIRPSAPQFTVTSFGLLEKVDAFYDFGWWRGVITKKLTDSRYVVYFKHTNKVKEFSHLELRPHVEWKDDGWFTTSQVPIGDTPTTSIDKQTCSVTRSMKRSKATSNDKLIKPNCKKLKPNGVPSKEVSDQSAGQTVDKTKILHRGRKTPAKEDKSVDLKPPMITSARKKGKLSADSSGPKALDNTAGDLTLTTTTPNTVTGKPVTENIPSSVVIGLQCKEPSGNSNIPLSITNGDDQKPSFEKRSSFWETIGSMEAFRLFPQNPHFRPLDTLNESARERHAIYKMVDFSGVFENMCRLRCDHPRIEFQDQLEILLELETHGFDVHSLRSCLMEMLSCKDKREALEMGSKDPEHHLEIERVKVQERKIDVMLIDSQIAELRNKRERLVKENEESTMNIAAWEKQVAEIEEAKCDCLQCKALTASQTKTSKRLISKSLQNDKETDGSSSTIRKWGKTFRRQPTNRKTSVALSNQNGDASFKKQKEKSNTTAKGKRGRNLISLNIESSPQVSVDLHDSSAQIVLVNGTSDIVVKTLDLVSENQSLSRSFLASLESAGSL
ncbi:putative Agenet-like domain-containing protein [Helianthus anomalus]